MAGHVTCSEHAPTLLHNGNDALVLLRDGVPIDRFGVWGDNGNGTWGGKNGKGTMPLCGNPPDGGAKDHTVVRKPSVIHGVAEFNMTAESALSSCSWVVRGVNAFDSHGSHDCAASVQTPAASCHPPKASTGSSSPTLAIAAVVCITLVALAVLVKFRGKLPFGSGGATYSNLSISADAEQDDEVWDDTAAV
jgi:hypothetical protein